MPPAVAIALGIPTVVLAVLVWRITSANDGLRGIARATPFAGLTLLLAVQFVPYGRDHTNPPVGAEPAWDSPRTRELAQRACFQCHGSETTWPWYSNVSPASWLVYNDVAGAREKLNFSNWTGDEENADESGEKVRSGEMPPRQFLLVHPEARLSSAEQDELIRGLEATFGVKQRRGRG